MMTDLFEHIMWTNGDPMRVFGTLVAGSVTIVIVVGLIVSFVRRRRDHGDAPWRTEARADGHASSVETTELESMRQTLGLPPKADEEKDREHARRVLAKGRLRRLFGK